LGLAPAWKTGACDTTCQEYISACMIAHINTAGVHIPLWIVAQHPAVGWGLDPGYPNQEGSFFGNIFVTGAHGYAVNNVPQVAAFYCNGVAYDKGVVPGRIGSGQTNAPYTDPFLPGGPYTYSVNNPGTGYCIENCTAADNPNAMAGYKACGGWNNVVTVYRQAATGGTIKGTGTGTSTGMSATISKYNDSTVGYCANVAVKNGTSATVTTWTVMYDIGTAQQYSQWLASETAVSGSVHTARGLGGTTAIAAGGTYTFGYCVNYKSGVSNPSIKSVSTP
jgi:hypothetical protein